MPLYEAVLEALHAVTDGVAPWCSCWRTCTGPTPPPATCCGSCSPGSPTSGCSSSAPTAPTTCTGATRCAPARRARPAAAGGACRGRAVRRRRAARVPAACCTAASCPDAVVEDIRGRSEGNAYYAEELLAAADDDLPAAGPPGRPARAARRRAPRPARAAAAAVQQVARVASVAGRRVPDALLRAASACPSPRSTRRCARPSRTTCSCRRRRSLRVPARAAAGGRLRRPAARRAGAAARHLRTHARCRRRRCSAADLARHCMAAHDLAGALAASVRAAEQAVAVLAPAEALGHYEQALQLWRRSPGRAAARRRACRLALRAAAAPAAAAGELDRAVRSPAGRYAPARRRRRGGRARPRWRTTCTRPTGDDAACGRARPSGRCSRARGRPVGCGPRRSRPGCQPARSSRDTGAGRTRPRRGARPWARVRRGRPAHQPGDAERAAGRVEAAAERLAEANRRASRPATRRRAARGRSTSGSTGSTAATSGRAEHLETASPRPSAPGWPSRSTRPSHCSCCCRRSCSPGSGTRPSRSRRARVWAPTEQRDQFAAVVLAARDRPPAGCPRGVGGARAGTGGRTWWNHMILVPRADAMRWRAVKAPAPWPRCTPAWQVKDESGEGLELSRLYVTGVALGVLADWPRRPACGATRRSRRGACRGRRAARPGAGGRRQGRPRLGSLGPEGRAWLARGEAEHARLQGRADPDAWRRSVEAFGFGQRYEVARSRRHLAEALVAAGDRVEAGEQARLARGDGGGPAGTPAARRRRRPRPPRPARPGQRTGRGLGTDAPRAGGHAARRAGADQPSDRPGASSSARRPPACTSRTCWPSSARAAGRRPSRSPTGGGSLAVPVPGAD